MGLVNSLVATKATMIGVGLGLALGGGLVLAARGAQAMEARQ